MNKLHIDDDGLRKGKTERLFVTSVEDECTFCTGRGAIVTQVRSVHPERRLTICYCDECLAHLRWLTQPKL